MRGRISAAWRQRETAHIGRVNEAGLDTACVACAESRSPRPDRWDWLEVREYLVLMFDGTTVRFPVRDGDVAQARLRAALVQRPETLSSRSPRTHTSAWDQIRRLISAVAAEV